MTTTSPKPFTWAEQDNAELSNVWNLLIEHYNINGVFETFLFQWLNSGGVFHFCRLWASQCHLQRGASTRVRKLNYFHIASEISYKINFPVVLGLLPQTNVLMPPLRRWGSLKTQTRPLKIWTWQRLVMIYTFQTKFRFYTWSQTRVTCLPFPLPFPR